MNMKTILVPTETDDAMRSALETALLLAQRCDAYIEGFALRGGVSEIVAVDAMGGFTLERYSQDIADQAMQAQQIFEFFMQEHHVPRATRANMSLSFGWLDNAPEGEDFVGSYGRVFDLIVMNRSDANSSSLHNRAIEFGLSKAVGRYFYLRCRHHGRLPPTC